jgi:hypothetical protein
VLETAARNGFVTAYLDGDYVSGKSSPPRVRLKSFKFVACATTLRPVPYTLTPYTLYLMPYTLYPKMLYPIPDTLYPMPYTLHPMRCLRNDALHVPRVQPIGYACNEPQHSTSSTPPHSPILASTKHAW